MFERLGYRGHWSGTSQVDPRNFTYEIQVSLWDCEEVGSVCGKVIYPDVYEDEVCPGKPLPLLLHPTLRAFAAIITFLIFASAATWTLLNPKGEPTQNELLGGADRQCSTIVPGVPLDDEFDDCWGFDEFIPEASSCAITAFCRTYMPEEISEKQCEELCVPYLDGDVFVPDAPDACCVQQEEEGECTCACVPPVPTGVDFILLSPTLAYYNWGTDRVLARLYRTCPQNDYATCILTCPTGSVDFGLCLEACQETCPPSLNAAANDQANASPINAGAIAGIVAASVAGVAVVGAIYRAKTPKRSSGHVELLGPFPKCGREQALTLVEGGSAESYEVASV